MRFLVFVRISANRKRTFRIDAATPEEAQSKLPNRLHPDERDSVIIDKIEIDPQSIGDEEPYGVYLHE